MTKKFLKNNRGQMLYAVLVAVIFLSMLAMLAMGLTLQNYHAAQQKQQHVSDYYAADAAAEMLRLNGSGLIEQIKDDWDIDNITETIPGEGSNAPTTYVITRGTVTLTVGIQDGQFKSWEVRYHAVETEQADADQAS